SSPPPLERPVAPITQRNWEFVAGPTTGILLSGSALKGSGLDAAGRIAAHTGVRVYANRNAGRTESGRGRFQPVRIPYFPEPAEQALGGLERLILVEAKPPVSFFGYPGRRSTLAPPDCQMHVLAHPGEDGTAALQALADDLGAGTTAARVQLASSPPLPAGSEQLTPANVAQIVSALLPEHAIVADEAISSGEALWSSLLQAAPHDHLPVTGGSIGQGMPVAVGAAVACPDRKVVCLEADGSAMYTLQALWTMARERLDVVTVIYNNRRYRILDVEMQRTGVQSFGAAAERMIGIGSPEIDFVRLSEAMGVEASRASTVRELADQFASALRTSAPRLIEAIVP
ncbi:MAG TPA: acetolactate synthase large subunit, partial [Bryobacteraceae bacterium]|nr:acetolactate synthase large subunit [Bryobacteraceae bacterium]